MSDRPKIIVLTPVKNEAWILKKFLAVATRCADLVIIADQNSTDGSIEISRSFPNVHVIPNPDRHYDEFARQRLLIDEARRLVAGPRILLGLDADEIIAANALECTGWQSMQKAPAGTVLFFEKVDVLESIQQCIRYATPWPLGFVDDGAPHRGTLVHSLRVPIPENASRLEIHDVKIMHFALTRPRAQLAKSRLYSVIENTNGTWRSLLQRRWFYSPQRNYVVGGQLGPVEPKWLDGWQSRGVDLHDVRNEPYYWQDFEVLRHFQRYGTRRFWLDDIWHFDWEACRCAALAAGMEEIPGEPLHMPPRALIAMSRLATAAYGTLRKWKRT